MLTKDIVNSLSKDATIGSVLYFDRVEKTDPFGIVIREKQLILDANAYVVQMHGTDPECLSGKCEPFSHEKHSELDAAIEAYNSIDMNVHLPYYYR